MALNGIGGMQSDSVDGGVRQPLPDVPDHGVLNGPISEVPSGVAIEERESLAIGPHGEGS